MADVGQTLVKQPTNYMPLIICVEDMTHVAVNHICLHMT